MPFLFRRGGHGDAFASWRGDRALGVPEIAEAFGPKAVNPELNRTHEIEGVCIAGQILKQVQYDKTKTEQILEIIEGHDSRSEALSLNDMIVKDADKLWRYTKSGLDIDVARFDETVGEGLARLRSNISNWFFTRTAREIAEKEIRNRTAELKNKV